MIFRIAVGTLVILYAGLSGAASSNNIAAALADPNRPEADTKRDANRKPAELLAFAGIKSGDTVIELAPGQYYFTRILSNAVGPRGRVYAYIPSDLDKMYKDHNIATPPPPPPHYPNVTIVYEPIAKVHAPQAADVVWTSDDVHDFYGKMFGPADMTAVNAAIYGALKPGGTYIVIDHAAAKDSGTRDTGTVHRIESALVKRDVLSAGFTFAGESSILSNPADDHTQKVWEPPMHDHTDQFVFKFKKPK